MTEIVTTEIVAYNEFRAQLAELKEYNDKAVFDYESPKGNKDAQSHVHKLRKTKSAVDACRKTEKAQSLAYGRKVDGEAKEATERAEKEAEQAAKRQKEKAERAAEQLRIDKERAIQAQKDAEERASNAAKEAEKRLAREAEEKKKAEAAAQAKREANKKHLAKINSEAIAALVDSALLTQEKAKLVVMLIKENQIPNVSIKY